MIGQTLASRAFTVSIALSSLLLRPGSATALDIFRGWDDPQTEQVTVAEMMRSQYTDTPFFSETYFHEAHFEEQEVTVFIFLTVANYLRFGSGCKLNVTITYADGRREAWDDERPFGQFDLESDPFSLTCGSHHFEMTDQHYRITAETDEAQLQLDYDIATQPARFGNGMIQLDKNSYLYYSVPLPDVRVTGTIHTGNRTMQLEGKGSVHHDHTNAFPSKLPRYYHSFWLSNTSWSVILRTIAFANREQVDQLFLLREGKVYDTILNCGLIAHDYVIDPQTQARYPTRFTVSFIDAGARTIQVDLRVGQLSDALRVFDYYPPVVRSVVKLFVPEMWSWRFWCEADVVYADSNGGELRFRVQGLGNYIDHQ